MLDYEYDPKWPPELKAATRSKYRALCRVVCLEGKLPNTNPDELGPLLDELVAANEDLIEKAYNFANMKLRCMSWRN